MAVPKLSENVNFGWPPPCILQIFSTGKYGKAVKMYGYLKRALVTFREPWLQVAGGGDTFNLPSGAKYEFTFVHAPTYRNNITGFGSDSKAAAASVEAKAQATFGIHGHADADWVRDNFYSALELAKYQEITQSIGIRGLQKGKL